MYEVQGDNTHVVVVNKDRITAGDGARAHDLEGKAAISNATNGKVFTFLNEAGECRGSKEGIKGMVFCLVCLGIVGMVLVWGRSVCGIYGIFVSVLCIWNLWYTMSGCKASFKQLPLIKEIYGNESK